MNYTAITLFFAGLLGLVAHAFKKTDERNKAQEPKYSILNYCKDNINGMLMCVICLMVCVYYKDEVKQLKDAGNWLGLGFFALGYSGDSAFPALLDGFGKIVDKIKSLMGNN